MKKFKKSNLVTIRMNDAMLGMIDALVDYMKMDRSDLIRLFISNGVKFYHSRKREEVKHKYMEEIVNNYEVEE